MKKIQHTNEFILLIFFLLFHRNEMQRQTGIENEEKTKRCGIKTHNFLFLWRDSSVFFFLLSRALKEGNGVFVLGRCSIHCILSIVGYVCYSLPYSEFWIWISNPSVRFGLKMWIKKAKKEGVDVDLVEWNENPWLSNKANEQTSILLDTHTSYEHFQQTIIWSGAWFRLICIAMRMGAQSYYTFTYTLHTIHQIRHCHGKWILNCKKIAKIQM